MCPRAGAHLGKGNALSASVVLSMSVERAMEFHMRINDVFLGCVFERHDAVCHVCPTRKKRLGDLLVAALGGHLFKGEEFLRGADHSLCGSTF